MDAAISGSLMVSARLGTLKRRPELIPFKHQFLPFFTALYEQNWQMGVVAVPFNRQFSPCLLLYTSRTGKLSQAH
jgi:hypothetical protein